MHEHSSYSVEGQQPDYLDTVLEIFNWHKHPFIMVEECALTWMGAAVVMGQVLPPIFLLSLLLAEL